MNAKKNRIYITAGLVLILIAAVWMIIKAAKTTDIFILLSVLEGLIACAAATAYALLGYKKDAAKFYKIFMVMYALSALLSALPCFLSGQGGIIDKVAAILTVIGALILAFVKDLGEQKTLIIADILAILYAVVFIYKIFTAENFFMDAQASFTGLVLSILAIIFIKGKYIDKHSRGSH